MVPGKYQSKESKKGWVEFDGHENDTNADNSLGWISKGQGEVPPMLKLQVKQHMLPSP
jgi:hypothetical protein